MERDRHRGFRRAVGAVVGVIIWLASSSVLGIVVQNDLPLSDRPGDAVIGRWGGNSCAVAIAPDYAVTTIHQSGLDYSTNSSRASSMAVLVFGQTVCYPTFVAAGGSGGGADLRLVKLWADPQHTIPADLREYSRIYAGSQFSMPVVLGGLGQIRGAGLTADGVPYGYQWGGTGGNANGIHWGTNTILGQRTLGSTAVIYGFFDSPRSGAATAQEAMPAKGDSGGGVFVKVDGQWKLLGLIEAIDSNVAAAATFSDAFYAIQMGLYAQWLKTLLPSGYSETGQGIASYVPEPGSLILCCLVLGGMAARRRTTRRAAR